MKKLLAIAIAAAITVPMAAMADTTVYGKGHVSISDTNAPGSKLNVSSHSSRIGLKGSNALDNGLVATHKFELGIDLSDSGGQAGALENRDTWVGLKGGFGEVRIGRHTVPSDLVDDSADFMTNGAGLNGGGRADNAIAYINKFGGVGFAAAHVAPGNDSTANDLMVNYAAGPLYAGLGYGKAKGGNAATKLALAYKGANYGVGFVTGKNTDKTKFNTLSGKYSFGKAYVAGQWSKNKDTKATQNIFEAGYGLGKGTKVYFDYTAAKPAKVGNVQGETLKTTRVGLVHSF